MDLSYLYVYFILMIAFLPFGFRKATQEVKIAYTILFLIVIIIVSYFYGGRLVDVSHGGIDTSNYRIIFNSMGGGDWFNDIMSQRIEKGYSLFLWIVNVLSGDFSIQLFLQSILILLLVWWVVIKATANVAILFTILLLLLLYLDSYNISRMILSVLISVFFFQYLSKEKYFKAIFFIFISISIQMSAIWCFVILIYYKFITSRIRNSYKVFVFFMSLAVSFSIIPVFSKLLTVMNYGYYIVDNENNNISYFNYIYALFLMFFYFSVDNNLIKNRISKVMFLIIPSIFLIIPLYMVFPIAYRFNYFYFLCFAFLIPDVIGLSFLYIKQKKYIYIISVLVPIIYSLIKIYVYFQRDVYYLLDWYFPMDSFIF